MKIQPFYVAPVLPDELKPIQDIAMNLWYSWNWEAVRLFIRMNAETWEESYQNPVALLGRLPQGRLKQLAQDDSFVAGLTRIQEELDVYLYNKKWFDLSHHESKDMLVGYFSCEFGLDEGLPIYSGGLGVLSGDHLKTASDMGIPLVAVGLLYREGYFRQRLNSDGWQLEEYPENDWYNMPVKLETDESGKPILITVEMGDKTVYARIWRVQVGNVRLYLLGTNFSMNPPWAREITTRLYGGDRDMRLRQELLLGIGGTRALKALGLKPTVYHLNEGHSAFLILERIRMLMEEEKLSFEEAREVVWASNVFTTHTPVPAGNEQFEPELLKFYLENYVGSLGLSWDEFLRLGRITPRDTKEPFGMTVWALRLSAHCNGVSKLHGEVSRNMWSAIWPNLPANEIPISHITNGIHPRSWISHDMLDLFESYLGPRFVQKPWEFDVWDRIDRIPDVELWRTHQRRRERLVFFVRKRLKQQLLRRGAHQFEINAAEEVLDPHALTIGFARRFATYKRAALLFSDQERLRKLISDSERPIQFIFAGKAHPQDIPGKEIIKSIIHFIRDEPYRSHFVFVEDYDINVARYLVQGVDVWMNTPRRPLEASGTSGMKAAANGGLNLSILDGWWCEGYHPDVGWAIGGGEEYADNDYQDRVESQALYNCLEHEVIPLFYDRNGSSLPRKWISKMKSAMKSLGQTFNTHRMVKEYTENLYLPAHQYGSAMYAESYRKAKELSAWHKKIQEVWHQVKILDIQTNAEELYVGEDLTVTVRIQLGQITPEDVAVEVQCGRLDSMGNFCNGRIYLTRHLDSNNDGIHTFAVDVPCEESGRHGFAVRARPCHVDLVRTYSSEFVVVG
ncbi:MAG: glycosyltransferase family 1 protein [Candidatus Omnitrophota bacterium]|jgi:starch phosphorylase|nr:MAG: glycosyltransferase family 1 protein [Candidatus Omnitrophota bacterium]